MPTKLNLNKYINNDYSLKDMGKHQSEMMVHTGSTIRNLNEENVEPLNYAKDVQSVSSVAVDAAQLSGLNLKGVAKLVGFAGVSIQLSGCLNRQQHFKNLSILHNLLTYQKKKKIEFFCCFFRKNIMKNVFFVVC